MLKRLSVILGLSFSVFVIGQDVHFTQFDKNPLMLNPGLTGNFEGDWRYSVNQRSQWRSVSRSFNTLALSAENKQGIILPNLYHGVNYMNDVAGDGDYRTHELNISNAYSIYLNEDSSQVLIPAVQFGINHKRIDLNAFKYDVQFNGYKYDENLPTNETFSNEKYTNLNFSIGTTYINYFKNNSKLEVGMALFNLVSKKESFFGNPAIKRNKRLVIHGRYVYPINFEWDVLPGLFFQSQGKYRELNIGANIRYSYLKKKGEYIAPYAGVWFRNKDAINIVAGLYYNNWIGGVSYDINVSQLTPASNIRGGLEFSLQYIINIFKPKNIQYRVCPDYL